MASKWKLTKADEKAIENEKRDFIAEAEAAGKSQQEIDKLAEAFVLRRASEIKTAKYLNSQAKKVGVVVAQPHQPQAEQPRDSYVAELQTALSEVLRKMGGAEFVKHDPLAIKEDVAGSGVQAVFDAAEAKLALRQKEVYLSVGNFFWVNHLATLSPMVPLSLKRVKALASFLFADGPTHLSSMIHVGIRSHEEDILEQKGALLRLSPDEIGHAVIFAAAEAQDDELIERWRHVLLSVPFKFEILDSSRPDSAYWRAWELRQMVSATDDSVRRSARQMIFEISSFRKMKEAQGGSMSVPQIQVLFQAANTAGSNILSEGIIKEALYLADHIQALAWEIITWFEDLYNLESCLNSISKLKVLIEKCPDRDDQDWVFASLKDAVSNGGLLNENISRVALVGTATVASLIDLMRFRRRSWRHFVDVEFAKLGINLAELSVIKAKTESHDSFRNASAQLSWMGGLKESSLLAFRLLEAAAVKI